MSNERIDIEVQDKVSPAVKDKLLAIAAASRSADGAVAKLRQQLASIDVSAVTKLADASAKMTNALAREMNAQARLMTATARTAAEDAKAALAKQRLATESARTAAAEARLATEQQKTATATAQAQAAASRYEAALLRLKAAQDKATQGNNALGSGGASSRLGSMAQGAITAAAGVVSGKAILDQADAYTTLENKLRTVTDSSRQLEAVQKELFTIANETRTPVGEVASGFQRFDDAMKQLGGSQRETLDFTRTLNQAIQLSGATTQEAASGILQLGQAFGSGVLQGEELKAILENTPVVADILAKQLKVTRGELKQLGADGKITADVMRQAFAAAKTEIADRFAKSVPTLGQSMNVLKNNFMQYVGEVDKATGATRLLSQGILGIANNMTIAAPAIGALIVVTTAFSSSIVAGFGAASAAVRAFTIALLTNPVGLLLVAFTAVVAILYMFRDSIKVAGDGITTLGDVFRALWEIVQETFASMVAVVKPFFDSFMAWAKPVIETVTGWFKGFGDNVDLTFRGIVTGVAKYYDTIIGVGVGAVKALIAGLQSLPAAFADVFFRAVNAGIQLIQDFVNKAIVLLNKLIGAFNTIGDNPLTRQLGIDFKAMSEIKPATFDKIENKYAGSMEQAGTNIKEAFMEGFNGSNALTNAVTKVFDRATRIANERADAARELATQKARAGDPLRQAGKATKKPGEDDSEGNDKAAKAAEKRAGALAKINRELDTEIARMGMLKPERELQQQLDQYENDLASKKIKLTNEEREAIKKKLQAIQEMKLVQQQLDQIYDQTTGKEKELKAAVDATAEAYKRGLINATNYQDRMVQLGLQAVNLRLQMGNGSFADVLTAGIGKVVQSYQGLLPGLSSAFGSFFTSFSQGFADSVGRAIVYSENLNDALMNVAKQALSQLISALIQLGIQWVMNQVLAATLGTAATAATAAMATATAAAWAPAAAMASLASFGANAAPASAALTATTALAQGLALAKGFESGGYTGDYGTKQIAGVVHGKEYVVNADATARNRRLLEAMNRGADVSRMLPGYEVGGYVEPMPYRARNVGATASNEGAPRTKRNGRSDGSAVSVTLNLTAHDAASFVKSEGQVAAATARAVQRGMRNL